MSVKSTWERFFDAHAPIYDGNAFTRSTAAEVEFLLEELHLPAGGSVLDVGCGTGRHAIALAGRGHAVTGLDLSSEMLARARQSARAAGVEVDWVQGDATRFAFPAPFDAAICLCEGAFGLLGPADDPIEQPLSILRNVARSLRPGAKALFTVLSAAPMLRRASPEDVAAGRFDPMTLVASTEMPPREGHPPVAVRERGFVPTELALLFRAAGLSVLNLWGGTAGRWGRRPLDLDDIEIMAVVCRPAAEARPSDPAAAGRTIDGCG
jgi:SAM-dependent methyltransferase